MEVKNKIIDEIRKIYDPELPVNIYELGLIYDIQVKGKKAEKLLEKLRERYRFPYYSKNILAQTEKLFLYTIGLNLYVYNSGLDHMYNLSDEKIDHIFKSYSNKSDFEFADIEEDNEEDESKFGTGKKRFKRILRKYRKSLTII